MDGLQQAGHGESVTRDCGMGSAGLPALAPPAPQPGDTGGQGACADVTFHCWCWPVATAAAWPRWQVGAQLGGRPATGHGNADVGGSQAATRHQPGLEPGSDISGQICLIGGCVVLYAGPGPLHGRLTLRG